MLVNLFFGPSQLFFFFLSLFFCFFLCLSSFLSFSLSSAFVLSSFLYPPPPFLSRSLIFSWSFTHAHRTASLKYLLFYSCFLSFVPLHNVLRIYCALVTEQGVKYLVALRADIIPHILPSLLPVIMRGLSDEDDDVRAAAAEALLPISDVVIAQAPDQLLPLLNILWSSLLDLDDLTASTSSIMKLLATLYAVPGVSNQQV